jgi:hypothetical protein
MDTSSPPPEAVAAAEVARRCGELDGIDAGAIGIGAGAILEWLCCDSCACGWGLSTW